MDGGPSTEEVRIALLGATQQIIDHFNPDTAEGLASIGRQRVLDSPLPMAAHLTLKFVLDTLRQFDARPSWEGEIIDAHNKKVRDVMPLSIRLRDWIATAKLNAPVRLPDHLIGFLVAADAANKTKDGPQPSGKFRWKGKLHKLPPYVSRIIEFMWGKEAANESDLMDYVWGHDNETSPENLRKHISIANRHLVDADYNRSLHRKRGKVSWQ
jgi:hypothetical protein